MFEPREVAAPASADEAVRSLAATIEDLLAESEMPTPRTFDVLRIPGTPARRADDAKPLAAAEGKSPARTFRGRQLPPPPPIFKISSAQTSEVARTGDLVGDIASEIARQLRGAEAASDIPGSGNHTSLVAHDRSPSEEPRETFVAEPTAGRDVHEQTSPTDRSVSRHPAPAAGEPHTGARFLSEHATPLSRQSEPERAVPLPADVPPVAHAAPWSATVSSVAARIPPTSSRDPRGLAIAAAERYEPAAAQTDWYGVPIETARATAPAPAEAAAEPTHPAAPHPHRISAHLPDRATAQPANAFATDDDAQYDYATHVQADDASHDPMDSPRIVTSRMAQPVPANQHSRVELTSVDDQSEQLPRWLSLSRDNPSSRRAGRTGLIVGGALAAAALLGYAGAGGIDLIRGLWSLPESATNEPAGATTLVAAQPAPRNADASARPAKAALMALLGGEEDKFEETETNAAASEGVPTFPVRTATLAPELPAAALQSDNRTGATGAVEPIYAEAKVTVPTADEVRAFLQALRRGA
ncbi:MAG: hypothetical protein GC150_09820, partial [Rhizobiales bacterium]|nr:hypothetical protein [Hyphomicrobiales bacterium]